jgi:ATP-dependent Clp protease ATP-binding subunit ClpB
VNRPESAERRMFLSSYLNQFHGAAQVRHREQTIREMVDLTDGLSNRDMQSLISTSRLDKLAVTQPMKLINRFKVGKSIDLWEELDIVKIRTAARQLPARVVGQPSPIRTVVDVLEVAKSGISTLGGNGKAGAPKAKMIFAGPTGVGKTELAKAVAELVYGDENAFIRIDMSEYGQEHNAARLIGAPAGYVGFDSGGVLTNHVRNKPFSLVLFDEMEKAHPKVFDLFLQILDDGRLTDGHGETVYFGQAAIIFTSNIGSDALDALLVQQEEPDYAQIKEIFNQAVKDYFARTLGRPELLGRFGDIVPFDIARAVHVPAVCEKFLDILARRAMEKHEYKLVFDTSSIIAMLTKEMSKRENVKLG